MVPFCSALMENFCSALDKKIRWYGGVDAIWALFKYRMIPLRSFVIENKELKVSRVPKDAAASRANSGKA